MKSLAKEKSQRYQSVDALAEDLRRFLNGDPVLAHPPSMGYQLRKFAARHRFAIVAAISFFAMASAFTITAGILAEVAWTARQEEREARRVAEQVSAFLGETLTSARPARGGPDVTVLQVLADAGRRAENDLRDQPAVAAKVHYAIGDTYRSLWRWNEARPHLEIALALTRQVGGEADETLAQVLTSLGTVYTSMRDPEAVFLQREALAIRRRLHGDEHPLVALSMTKLAYAMHQSAEPPNWQEAERLFQEAISLYRRVEADPRDLAACLHNYGWMRVRQRRLIDAVDLYENALEVFEGADRPNDPFYAECFYGYSAQLFKLGRHADSLAALDRAIPLVRGIYGRTSVVELLWLQVDALRSLGRDDAARAACKEAFALMGEKMIDASPEAADKLHMMQAALDRAVNDPAATLPTGTVFDVMPNLLPASQERLAHGLSKWARTLLAGNDREGARQVYEQLGAISGLVDHEETSRALAIISLEGRADVAIHESQHVDAHRLLAECLEVAKGSADRPDRAARIQSKLGASLIELGRYVEAERTLLESQVRLAAELGSAHRATQFAVDRLIRLYETWGKADRASEWQSHLTPGAEADQAVPDMPSVAN